ncbi:MAG: SDR family NAD(P)-dependent oxidoreductase, partial [Acidobacteriaceae bacterium]
MEDLPTYRLFDLHGQVAVITGGAGILCSSLCIALAKAGVKVGILDVKIEAAHKLADEINAIGGEAIAVECDVCQPESIKLAAQRVISTYEQVDIL